MDQEDIKAINDYKNHFTKEEREEVLKTSILKRFILEGIEKEMKRS